MFNLEQFLESAICQLNKFFLDPPHTWMANGTIASKMNVTLKSIRLSENLQHSVIIFDRSSKFDCIINCFKVI